MYLFYFACFMRTLPFFCWDEEDDRLYPQMQTLSQITVTLCQEIGMHDGKLSMKEASKQLTSRQLWCCARFIFGNFIIHTFFFVSKQHFVWWAGIVSDASENICQKIKVWFPKNKANGKERISIEDVSKLRKLFFLF